MKFSIDLPYDKETKHKVRYQRPGAVCSTIYLEKSALPRPWPKQITVMITDEDHDRV